MSKCSLITTKSFGSNQTKGGLDLPESLWKPPTETETLTRQLFWLKLWRQTTTTATSRSSSAFARWILRFGKKKKRVIKNPKCTWFTISSLGSGLSTKTKRDTKLFGLIGLSSMLTLIGQAQRRFGLQVVSPHLLQARREKLYAIMKLPSILSITTLRRKKEDLFLEVLLQSPKSQRFTNQFLSGKFQD